MASLLLGEEPDEKFEAFRRRVLANQPKLKAEIEAIMKETEAHRPSPEKTAAFLELVERAQNRTPLTPGPFPTAEEMIREDRDR
jgi:hypothetical protein